MKLLNKLNSIQKYQLFFFLTAILPISVFAIMLFEHTQVKLNRAVYNQVKPGVFLVKDAIEDNYNDLRVSSQQETKHIIKNEKSFNNVTKLQSNLVQFKKANQIDIVMLLTPDGKLIETGCKLQPKEKESFEKYLKNATKNPFRFGLKLFKINGQNILSTFYLTPYYVTQKQTNGVLLVGDFLRNNPHFDSLSMLNPDYSIRIVEKKHKNTKLINNSRKNIINSPSETEYQQIKPKIFFEKINGMPYASAILAVQNSNSEIIGQIIFSIPYDNGLLKNNLILISLACIFALIFVLFVGKWFENAFIIPMNKLTLAFNDVSKGNLKNRLIIPAKSSKEAANSLDSFNAMLDNLEESKNLKDNLVATLTHDLRTPLLAQECVIEILKNEFDSMDKEQKNQMFDGLIKNNCNLLEMINTLLESYEYENKTNITNKEIIVLDNLIDTCVFGLEPLIQQKNIQFEKIITPDSLKIYGNEKDLKRVFTNLIANAIQNISKGSQIKVIAEKTEKNIEIKIIDNGPGIPPEMIPYVFERYYSGHTLQKKIGSGLGLYICRTIVELHQGTIKVESANGNGTIFTIKMPYPETGENYERTDRAYKLKK